MDRKVLIIEDDLALSQLIAMHLRDLGCETEAVPDGATGLARARSGEFGLVILDLMLPQLDGMAVCHGLRTERTYTPILMLTAKSTDIDRVSGLEAGADDYLTKPFNILELNARVKAIFRRVDALRPDTPPADEALQVGPLRVDLAARDVSLDGRPIPLTAREFDLLVHFVQHPGRVFSRQALLDQVWGPAHDGYEHTVNSHINRLRAKLERDPRNPEYILTVWGAGYKLAPAA